MSKPVGSLENGQLDNQALDMIEKLLLHGDYCPSCGRDNKTDVEPEEKPGVCTSHYCDGVLAVHWLRKVTNADE